MSKRDLLRPYMDIVDKMLLQMVFFSSFTVEDSLLNANMESLFANNFNVATLQHMEDPSFKPSGGRLGENDMDYDTDDKTMAALRRQLRRAGEEYHRYKRFDLFMFSFIAFFVYICNFAVQTIGWVSSQSISFSKFFTH